MEWKLNLKGEKEMSKFEFFGTLTAGLIGGFFIGYSKARELFLEALIKSAGQKKETKTES